MQQSLITEAVEFLSSKQFSQPLIGIVLGTGLNALVDHTEVTGSIPYHEIPNFPVSTVNFHKGQLIFGAISGVNVVIMQGRFHYYEGYSMQQIGMPVRIM